MEGLPVPGSPAQSHIFEIASILILELPPEIQKLPGPKGQPLEVFEETLIEKMPHSQVPLLLVYNDCFLHGIYKPTAVVNKYL